MEQNEIIYGVPKGYLLVGIGQVSCDEDFIDLYGNVRTWRHSYKTDSVHPIVRRIPTRKVLVVEINLKEGEASSYFEPRVSLNPRSTEVRYADHWNIEERGE